MTKRTTIVAVLMLALTCALISRVSALINPKFTPVHLVQSSAIILELRIAPEVKDGKATATVQRVLKGEFADKSLVIELTGATKPDQARLVEQRIKDGKDKPVLMFVGSWSGKPGEGEPGGGGPAAQRRGYLQMAAMWLVLVEDEQKVWGFDEVSQQLVATWNGGTDMLLRAVEYILKDPDAEVPVKTGVKWAACTRVGSVSGRVSCVLPLALHANASPTLFVASDAGDHLFACDKVWQDITGKCGLASKSRASAWADFNADGLLDLASWDGSSLTLFLQDNAGAFKAGPTQPLNDCAGLCAIDVGTPGKAGLIISSSAAPGLWVAGAEKSKPLSDPWLGNELGKAGPCLVADFDGDGLPEVLQVLAKGSLFYKATQLGAFASPKACNIAYGAGRCACLGDWDADGLLDVVTAGEEGCRLWQNLGGGNFTEALKLSGEIGYASKAGSSWVCNGDLNNDGRQDIAVLYATEGPQVFFNRGFRSFGVSGSLDLGSGDFLPGGTKGQQAGCLGDFNADGCQDLAVVLNDGQVFVITRLPSGADPCLRAALPAGSPFAGPLTVTATIENRGLGAWNVRPGVADTLIARPTAGPLTLKWQFPGEKPQTREVVLENEPVTVVLENVAGK